MKIRAARIPIACRPLGLFVLLFVALVASFPTVAHALIPDPDYWKGTSERQNTVNRFFYSQSPQAIPSSYDPVREAEEILRQKQRSLPPSNPKAPSVWRQVRTVTVKSAISTAPRALGVVGLASGAFELGWKIGSGVNAKFLRIGLPDPPARKASSAEGTLVFKTAGYSSALNTTPLPEDGWVLHWWYGSSQYTAVNLSHGWGHGCAYLSAPPADFRVLTGFASIGWCENPPVPVESYWLEENGLEAAGPVEPYTNQPYAKAAGAPAPPPQTTVEQSIENELEKPTNELLRQWLNYTLGSPGEGDPLAIGEPNPEIDFPNREKKWQTHRHDFDPEHADAEEYWRDAADVIKKTNDGWPDFEKCVRQSDNAEIFWDPEREAIVIVKDGKIDNFFPPRNPIDPGDTGYARRYFDNACAS